MDELQYFFVNFEILIRMEPIHFNRILIRDRIGNTCSIGFDVTRIGHNFISYKSFFFTCFFLRKTEFICVFCSFYLQTIPTSRLASLPPAFISDKPYANFYGLALVSLPPEEDDKVEGAKIFAQDALNRDLLLNVEYKYVLDSLLYAQMQMFFIDFIHIQNFHRVNGQPYATLTDPATSTDVGRALVADGILLVEKRREKKLKSLVSEPTFD